MSLISIENIKEHCRTCLEKLKIENRNSLTNLEEEVSDCKDFCISIVNIELARQFIASCMDEECINEETETISQEYPQCICIYCYKKLQSFVSFKNQVRNSTQKLQELLCLNTAKVEIVEDEEHQEIENNTGALQNTADIFNLLVRKILYILYIYIFVLNF